MKEISCKLLVIGAGPGGYTCAIRAGQLGIDTVIVEAKKAGGTCLNVGCIPSKALIHAAEEFDAVRHMAQGSNPFGIAAQNPVLDFGRTIAWKDGIVGRLNNGVTHLLKKAGVKALVGWATFRDGKTVEVATELGLQVVRAEQVVIATGSEAVTLPFLPVRRARYLVHGCARRSRRFRKNSSWLVVVISGSNSVPLSPSSAPT